MAVFVFLTHTKLVERLRFVKIFQLSSTVESDRSPFIRHRRNHGRLSDFHSTLCPDDDRDHPKKALKLKTKKAGKVFLDPAKVEKTTWIRQRIHPAKEVNLFCFSVTKMDDLEL